MMTSFYHFISDTAQTQRFVVFQFRNRSLYFLVFYDSIHETECICLSFFETWFNCSNLSSNLLFTEFYFLKCSCQVLGSIASSGPFEFSCSFLVKKKKVRKKSRECHNHKPQPFPDTKRK